MNATRSRWTMLLLLSAAVCLIGCAGHHQNQLVLDPVGPIEGGHVGRRGITAGFLQVYSATTPVNDGGIIYDVHTPYSIYTEEGKHFKGVVNHAGPDDQRPTTVELAPGNYRVYAMVQGFGQIQVPVVIESMKLTMVYLGRWGRPPLTIESIPAKEAVQLPDGRVVGRRATTSSNTGSLRP